MGFIIFIVALIIVGIVATIVATTSSKAAGVAVGSIVLVIAVVATLIASAASVPTGYTGILTTFGRVEDRTLDAGFNMKAPWQKVVKMDNRIQKVNVGLSAFSSDLQQVDVSYTINYQIDKQNAMNIYRSVGKQYYDVVIQPNILESFKVAAAKYTAEELIANRNELAAKVEELLSESLNDYNINVVSTAIEDMDFSDAFTNAVEEKQVAAQNALKAQIEQERFTMEKEAEAARSVIDANTASEVAKIQAQADLEVTKIQADAAEYAGQKEAAKNKAIAESLTPELVDYYYIDAWNGTLPSTYVGSENPSTIVTVK